MIVTRKHDGRPRRTVDLQRLNAQCLRETHHCESPFKLATQVPPNMKKTVLDATDGYHSIELDEESRPLTTFITEWGRYRYKRLPQGFVAAGDASTKRYDDIIKDIDRKYDGNFKLLSLPCCITSVTGATNVSKLTTSLSSSPMVDHEAVDFVCIDCH